MTGFARAFWNAALRLTYDGGLANAGNIALSFLLSLFPFMLLIAVLIDIWGEPELLEQVLELVFDHWPAESAGPIAAQMKVVLSQARGELFTIGNLVALILATNGIESARDGLNRAYQFTEDRSFILRRLQGAFFVTIGAVALILAAVILVGTPVVWDFLIERMSWLTQLSFLAGLIQYGVAISLLAFAIFSFHYFLPAGEHSSGDVMWGVLITIAGILIGSQLFSFYLTNIADYTSLYAGFAGVMIIIIYLYYLSVLILFGAEFNAAMKLHKTRK